MKKSITGCKVSRAYAPLHYLQSYLISSMDMNATKWLVYDIPTRFNESRNEGKW
ncbi:hypothetical protein HanPI659440_Chr12g0479531 [Helianthus annuus]|nr:hypothetical protein HanPI659440_Chr12g0479531 [Helianthus annuus]